MKRPGHHRPLGSTTRMRFEWSGDRLPEIGDIAQQVSEPGGDVDELRRSYRVVGFEEGRSRDRFRLLMERVEHGTLPDSPEVDRMWSFYDLPRRA